MTTPNTAQAGPNERAVNLLWCAQGELASNFDAAAADKGSHGSYSSLVLAATAARLAIIRETVRGGHPDVDYYGHAAQVFADDAIRAHGAPWSIQEQAEDRQACAYANNILAIMGLLATAWGDPLKKRADYQEQRLDDSYRDISLGRTRLQPDDQGVYTLALTELAARYTFGSARETAGAFMRTVTNNATIPDVLRSPGQYVDVAKRALRAASMLSAMGAQSALMAVRQFREIGKETHEARVSAKRAAMLHQAGRIVTKRIMQSVCEVYQYEEDHDMVAQEDSRATSTQQAAQVETQPATSPKIIPFTPRSRL